MRKGGRGGHRGLQVAEHVRLAVVQVQDRRD